MPTSSNVFLKKRWKTIGLATKSQLMVVPKSLSAGRSTTPNPTSISGQRSLPARKFLTLSYSYGRGLQLLRRLAIACVLFILLPLAYQFSLIGLHASYSRLSLSLISSLTWIFALLGLCFLFVWCWLLNNKDIGFAHHTVGALTFGFFTAFAQASRLPVRRRGAFTQTQVRRAKLLASARQRICVSRERRLRLKRVFTNFAHLAYFRPKVAALPDPELAILTWPQLPSGFIFPFFKSFHLSSYQLPPAALWPQVVGLACSRTPLLASHMFAWQNVHGSNPKFFRETRGLWALRRALAPHFTTRAVAALLVDGNNARLLPIDKVHPTLPIWLGQATPITTYLVEGTAPMLRYDLAQSLRQPELGLASRQKRKATIPFYQVKPNWPNWYHMRTSYFGFFKKSLPNPSKHSLLKGGVCFFSVSEVTLPKSNRSASSGSRSVKQFTLAFGPQHPAAHGILRINLQFCGELIQKADPHFGLLHRGTEKLMEARNLIQSLPYFDRFDYVANFYQEHAYCLAVEALHSNARYVGANILLLRTMFDELSRVANHLLTLSAVTMDMGAMGSMFWAFEEREQLMEFFERASGARMHTALYRPFSIDETPFTQAYMRDLARFVNRSARSLSGAFLGLLNNRAMKTRFASVGQLSPAKLSIYGISGIIARSSGLPTDLRLQRTQAYGAYANLSFRTFLGRRGDNWDRFIIRIKETVESLRIIVQSLQQLGGARRSSTSLTSGSQAWFCAGSVQGPAYSRHAEGVDCPKLLNPSNSTATLPTPGALFSTEAAVGRGRFSGMEELISHFRESSEGLPTAPGLCFKEVESPKGVVGVFLVTDGSSKPVRVKLRSPVAHNLHLIPTFSVGTVFADFVATFCSLDVVLGEIDR